MDRRRFLGALGLSAGGLAGATTRVRTGPVASWEPDAGTWPLERRDLANTAAAPDATLPGAPTVAWEASPLVSVEALVVGPERVYVTRTPDPERDGPAGRTVAAVDRGSGETDWTAGGVGGRLALRAGTLYVGHAAGDSLTAFDAASGDEVWRREGVLPRDGISLTVADGTVFYGGEDGFAALDTDSGTTRWKISPVNAVYTAVVDGSLFVSGGNVERLRSRRLSDVAMGHPPPAGWETDLFVNGWPVVVGDRVLVGQHGMWASTMGLHAFDAATGALDWRVGDELEVDPPYHRIGAPAVVGDRCVFDLHRPGREGLRVSDKPPVELVACSLADGNVRWRRAFQDARPVASSDPTAATGPVAVGGSVLTLVRNRSAAPVDGGSAEDGSGSSAGGAVRAFSAAGDDRWTFETPATPLTLAAAGPTVYAGTAGGTVYALE